MKAHVHKDFLHYSLHPDKRLVRSRWLTHVDSTMYREGMLHMQKVIQERQALYWLYDASRFTTPDMSDQQWTLWGLGPLLAQTALKKIAVLVPQDVLLQTVAERIQLEAQPVLHNRVRMENFLGASEAEEWLLW
ncbi:hypothetical protein ACFSRY_18785 [Pontibacter locisalis]|uniref:Uncharacterized protein n=1 Tax=Pontibacter locisalis TaxID=1719035 RepID=A0ABW5IRA3_9BACT